MNKMKKCKRFFIFGLILTLVVSCISGCQLAEEDGNYELSEVTDQLIGVMLTTKRLPEGKIYGKTYVEDGEIKVKFNIENAMFAYKAQGVDYVKMELSNCFWYKNIKMNVHEQEGSIENKEEITLHMYYEEDAEATSVYFNYIYVDKDNNIYACDAAYCEQVNHSESIIDSISKSYEENIDGNINKNTITFNLNIEYKTVLEEMRIIGMSDDAKEISRDEYTIDQLGEKITISNNVAFIVVEKLFKGEVVEREIISKIEEGKRILITEKGKNGFLIPRHIEVDWIEN